MTAPAPVPALILAAGESRRLGRPKQLVEVNGETLLSRAIRFARESAASPVFVVLGANAQLVRETISISGPTPGDIASGAVFVENSSWKEGVASSIRAGLNAVNLSSLSADGALLMTCDQPRITPEHLATLLHAFHQFRGPGIAASVYAGVRGIPAVFPRSVFPQLLALTGDTGARRLLLDPPCPLAEVRFPGGEVDIDTPADLHQL